MSFRINLNLGALDQTYYGALIPSLNLNADKNLEDYGLVNFTRSSEKTYFDQNGILQTAPANTNPVEYEYNGSTWERKGWSFWESRTNLVLNNNSEWVPSGSGVTIELVNSIYGSNVNALKFSGVDSRRYSNSIPNITLADGESVTFSVYFEDVTLPTTFQFFAPLGGSGTIHDPDGNQISSTTPIDKIGRYYCTATNNSGTADTISNLFGGASLRVGFGTVNIHTAEYTVSLIQFERGKFPSPPIITQGSQVTRSADIADITDLSWYNQNEGTFVVEANLTGVQGQRIFQLGTPSFRVIDLYSRFQGGVTLFNQDALVLRSLGSQVGVKTVAVGYSQNEISLNIDGINSIIAIPTGISSPTSLYIGANSSGTQNLNTYVKSLKYYPKRLSDSQLQSLTS